MPEQNLPVTYAPIYTREQRAILDAVPVLHQPRARERQELYSRHVGSVGVEGVIAEACPDPETETVTFILDQRSAALVIFAVRLLAADYEAHGREVKRVAETMPPNSYGAKNRSEVGRQANRKAGRLRAVEQAYRDSEPREYWGF